jgi:hypothetical protein
VQNKLKALIGALEVMDDSPRNKELKDVIFILKTMAADPQEKAKIEKDDNRISGYIVSIVTIMPEIMQHHKHQALIDLARKLKPTRITHVPGFILDKFFGNTLNTEPSQKKRPRS